MLTRAKDAPIALRTPRSETANVSPNALGRSDAANRPRRTIATNLFREQRSHPDGEAVKYES
jgi:hypothetical protein